MLVAICARLSVILLIVVVGGIVRGLRLMAKNAAEERRLQHERVLKAAEQTTSTML